MEAEGENAPSIQITNSAATDPIESSYDFYESIYQVSSSDTGKNIAYDGSLKVNATDTEETVQIIRYGELDETDDLNNIPVALQTSIDGKYFTLAKGSAAGTDVTLAASAAADRTQQFILKKSPSWSKDHLAYKIYHPISRMYLGYSAASPYTLQAYGKTAPEYDFVFSRTDYTVLGKVRTTAGYGILTDAQKKCVFDTLGGVGANSLGSYAKNGVTALQSVYENHTAKEADAQAADILTIIGGNAFGVSAGSLSALPGTSSVQTKILAQEEGNYDFWRGTKLDGTKYTLQITNSCATQTIDVYVQDNATAITNGKNTMEAIKQIPYPLRKNIKIMKIRNDSANSYNCNASDFYMRVNWTPTKDSIAQYMTYEFGHSMDYSYNVNGSGVWATARTADIVGVTGYGSSNNYEDFAEFSKSYFQCYGNINHIYGLRQMYPERYKNYVAVLKKTGYTDILEDFLTEKEESISQPAGVVVYPDETPELPETVTVNWADGTEEETAVQWDSFDTVKFAKPYAVAVVKGTVPEFDNKTVSITVMSIPRNLVYYIDCGTNGTGTSKFHSAIVKSAKADTLKNTDYSDPVSANTEEAYGSVLPVRCVRMRMQMIH